MNVHDPAPEANKGAVPEHAIVGPLQSTACHLAAIVQLVGKPGKLEEITARQQIVPAASGPEVIEQDLSAGVDGDSRHRLARERRIDTRKVDPPVFSVIEIGRPEGGDLHLADQVTVLI